MVKSIKIIFILFLLFAGKAEGVWGQDSKKVLSPDTRTALVGPDCMVTSFIQTVGVGEFNANVKNLLDTDLDNAMTIASIVGVDLVNNPIVQVKDRRHYYAKGTMAGFCMESVGGLLSINLINAKFITTFRIADTIDVLAIAFVFFLATYIALISPTTTLKIEPSIIIGTWLYPSE